MIRLNRTRKLDTGWRYAGSGVYENKHGDRVHVAGLRVRYGDSTWRVDEFTCKVYQRCLDVMGSRKRAIMLYLEYFREVNE